MQRTLLVSCALCLLAVGHAGPAAADPPAQREIDAARSSAQFSIEHIFVEHVTGTVPIASGTVTLDAGSAVPRSVTAVLDAKRIHTDEPDRDSALRSADYFDTAAFPTWTFVSTKIVATGTAQWTVDGLLTIHGVTQPEHLAGTVGGDSAHPTYHAVAHIDRHAFGMKGGRLDPVIGNDADVTLDIVLK